MVEGCLDDLWLLWVAVSNQMWWNVEPIVFLFFSNVSFNWPWAYAHKLAAWISSLELPDTVFLEDSTLSAFEAAALAAPHWTAILRWWALLPERHLDQVLRVFIDPRNPTR